MRHWLAVAAALSLPLVSSAQSGFFTYQGDLSDNGTPANGAYDIKFDFYTMPTGGTWLANYCTRGIPVTNGKFAVDIGLSTLFAGVSTRYVEISVRPTQGQSCADSTGFNALVPRQMIADAPRALGADVANALAAPDGTPSAAVAVDNQGWVGIGTQTPLAALDLFSGDVHMGLHTNGWFLHTRSSNAGDFVHLTDTINGAPQFQRGIVLTKTGRVGLGVTAPAAKLDVGAGDVQLGMPTNGWFLHTRSSFDGDFIQLTDTINAEPQFQHGVVLTKAGRVGIGTAGPAVQLHVIGDIGLGAAGQYRAAAGDENLRIIRGEIDADGTVLNGSGFTAVHGVTGTYYIYFTTPFAGDVTATATADLAALGSGSYPVALINTSGPDYVTVFIRDVDAGSYRNNRFHFIAVGPR